MRPIRRLAVAPVAAVLMVVGGCGGASRTSSPTTTTTTSAATLGATSASSQTTSTTAAPASKVSSLDDAAGCINILAVTSLDGVGVAPDPAPQGEVRATDLNDSLVSADRDSLALHHFTGAVERYFYRSAAAPDLPAVTQNLYFVTAYVFASNADARGYEKDYDAYLSAGGFPATDTVNNGVVHEDKADVDVLWTVGTAVVYVSVSGGDFSQADRKADVFKIVNAIDAICPL